VAEMRKHLTFSLSRASRTKHIRIYVDALDESGEEPARDIVQYFRRLTSQVLSTERFLSICFSCRSYPLKSVEGSVTICVEQENYKDIVKVVENALREFPLEQAQELTETIVNRASGVFQWVVLVVPKLLKLYRQGKNMKTITAELLQIPRELEQFYQDILESVNEKDLPQSLQLMRWLCFSRRPLTIEELRWAMVVDANSSYDSLDECKSSMEWADTDNTMENRLNYLSGGLAGVGWAEIADTEHDGSDDEDENSEKMTHDKIDSEGPKHNGDNAKSENEGNNEDKSVEADLSAPTNDVLAANPHGKEVRRVAQFIHQSVEDYLISSGLEKLDNYAKRSVVGRGHHSLLRTCIKYISMQEILSFSIEIENRHFTGSKLLGQGNGSETGGNEHGQQGTSGSLGNARQEKRIEMKAQIKDGSSATNQHLETGKLTLPTELQAEKPTEDRVELIISSMDEDPEQQLLRMAPSMHRDHTGLCTCGGESSQMGASRGETSAANSLFESWCQPDNQQLVVYNPSEKVEILPGTDVSSETGKFGDRDLQGQAHSDSSDTFSDADDKLTLCYRLGPDEWTTVTRDRLRLYDDKCRAELEFPFLHYAVTFCLEHAFLAEEKGVPQGILVELLQTPKLTSKGVSHYRQRRVKGGSPNRPSHSMITPWRCLHTLMNVTIFNDKSYIPANTTLLHIASKYALTSVVAELLDQTGDIDADPKDANGWTPLFHAAQQGHDAVARLLLQKGRVDPDTTGNDHWTPLSLSAACQSEGVMQMLLETFKVDVDRKDESGRTALFWASRFGTEAAVQQLLDTGKVDVNLKCKDGHSILSWATEELYHPTFKLPGGDIRLQKKEELTAIIQLLLNSGKIDLGKDAEGRTLLSMAAKNGHDILVQQLLETGKVDMDPRDSSGQTPLSLAAYNGHVNIVKRLLKTGRANVNSKDDDGRTPLSLALSYLAYINTLKPKTGEDEHEYEIRMLLATRKLNIKPNDMALWTGRLTPYSLERDHLAVARLLIDTGKIDVGPDDQWVQPPSEWLVINGNEHEDMKAARAASLARREKEVNEKTELDAAIAASLAKKEEEDQERLELEAAINVSLLKPDDEDAIIKAIMFIFAEDKGNLPRAGEEEINNTDYDYRYYDDNIELELAKGMSLADDIENPKLATQNTAGASSYDNSVPESRVQRRVDRLSGLESNVASSPSPAPKPKPEPLTQRLPMPTPPPKPGHLTLPSLEPNSKIAQSARPSPEPKPKPRHLSCTTEPEAKS
jgi:ankyrin repeat protein